MFEEYEQYGPSAKYRVATDKTVFLTCDAAEKWITDAEKYYRSNKQHPPKYTIAQINPL